MVNNSFRLTFICALVGLILEFGIIAVNAIECGTTDFARKLILRGTQTQRGEYPFLAALYLVEDRRFICGGSLISAKHVLTAAHCTKDHGIVLVPIDLIVLLGAYDLTSRIERDAEQRGVAEIRVHSDWKVYSGKYDADLAILVLSKIVEFTNFIRPVCLPADDSVIHGARGTIVGWGLSENGTEPNLIYPKHAMTTALNDSYCYTTDSVIASYSSLRTFCGGGEETSPSEGDSGGGFFVRHGSVWLQYGIISAIRSNASGYVDVNSIAVYTNVKDFKIWIKNTVRQSGGEVGEGIAMDKDTVRQSGGEVDEGIATGKDTVRQSGGEVGEGIAMDKDTVRQSGREVGEGVAMDKDTVRLSGVEVGEGNATDKDTVRQSGGEVGEGIATDKDTVRQSGGEVGEGIVMDKDTIRQSGGEVGEGIATYKDTVRQSEREVGEGIAMYKDTVRQSGVEVGEGNGMYKDTVRQSGGEVGEGNAMEQIKIQLNCRYSNGLYSGSLYGCEVYDLNIRSDNFEVASFTGYHRNGKTDEDVEALKFSNGTMIYLPDGIGNNFKNLKFLIGWYGLDTKLITRSNFKYLKSLKDLSIYDNNIETLEEDTLWDLPHLQSFRIYSNYLRKIKEETFVKNPELSLITLARNQLVSIPRNLFQKNFLLNEVWLSENNLKTIDEGTFANNPILQFLYLQRNQLEFLPANLLQNNLLLKEVNFSYNSIKIIKIDFAAFKYLEIVNLRSNLCTSINDYYYLIDNSKGGELQRKIRTSCSSVNIP